MKRLLYPIIMISALFTPALFVVNTNASEIHNNEKTHYYYTNSTPNQFVNNKEITVYRMVNNQPDYNQPVKINPNTAFALSDYFNKGNTFKISGSNDFFYLPKSNIKSFTYNSNTINLKKKDYKKLKNDSNDWKNGLSKKEVKAIGNYTTYGSGDINGQLRNSNQNNDPKVNQSIKRIKNGIGQFNLSNPMTVYRGTSNEVLNNSLNNQSLSVGKIYRDKGFSSTSIDQNSAAEFENNVLLKINLPAGYHGAYITPLAYLKSEKEYLLNPNTKMIVNNIQNVKTDHTYESKTNKNGKVSKFKTPNSSREYKLITLNIVE